MSKRAEFEDVADQGFGVLGSGGADQLDRVTTKITPAGPESVCLCEYCGTKNCVGCSWQEAITGSMGYLPPDWRTDQELGMIYPFVGCANGGCRRPLIVGFAPQELKRLVQSGIEQGFITKASAEAYAQQILSAAQGRR